MAVAHWDQSTLRNLRRDFGEKIAQFPDEQVIEAWKAYSTSEDYGDDEKFPVWCEIDFGT